MARISNTTAYSSIIPSLSDYFVLTDAENNLNTKTCTLENLQTLYGLNVTSVTVAVPSSYLRVIGTQQFTLLPAPGSEYVYDVSEIVSYMSPGGVTYDFVNTINITQGTIQEPLPLALLNSATKKVYKSDPSPAEFIPVNEGIVLGGLANPTQGDGTLYINITYRKLKLDTTF
tara:strand:+ start:22416 stop:22934 length:519 start_codon:yes stop_codon:yes gene_type:complete